MSDQAFLLVQAAVLLVILTLFLTIAFFQFKDDHLDGPKSLAMLGAGLFGLMFGLIVVFGVLPFRLERQGAEPPQWLPLLVLMIFALRSDRITSLPLIGKPLRAYRVASLRRTITQSRERLDKLRVARDTEGPNADE